ncbi:hypothetical protein ACOIDJ_32555, partial [Klebsiella pneumoniae]|uniref:hypothetical protein n=1 Tax=Klebsiella pneumoniae TaxID=573 RepID=UPI00301AA8EF
DGARCTVEVNLRGFSVSTIHLQLELDGSRIDAHPLEAEAAFFFLTVITSPSKYHTFTGFKHSETTSNLKCAKH